MNHIYLDHNATTPLDAKKSMRQRIAVAMSGGVDSSVAAALLCEQGHEVIGVTLKLQEVDEAHGRTSGLDGIARARAVADELGIPHHVLDGVGEFEKQVLRPAWDEYKIGRTPSPCLLCNERIKFGTLLSWSRQLGASLLATGHYARVQAQSDTGPLLLRGVDSTKDQSYFLAGLSRDQLSSVVFPLGHLTKQAVRERARSMGLSTAQTQESQDACLVGPDQSFAEKLRQRFGGDIKQGLVIDDTGQVLGQHHGIHHFTVGQRRGLRVASPVRRWVRAVRADDSTIVVTANERDLYTDRLTATGINWLGEDLSDRVLECQVQIRYRHVAEAAKIRLIDTGTIEVLFNRPVRAITPGQAVVLYDGARVLGRGWIHIPG